MLSAYIHSKISSTEMCIADPEKTLAALIEAAFGTPRSPVLIAVGGPGGTGKSTFARKLADMLGPDLAVILTLDSYKMPRHLRAQKNLFGPHPEANEMQMIYDHLLSLRSGNTIEKPCYCSNRGQICEFEPFAPAGYVIVEGEVSTYQAFRGVIDLAVFIDSHWKTQLNTRISRDIEQRGYTPEKAIATFLHSNLREFQEYGSPSKNWCDIHLHCSDDYTLVIDAVVEKYLPLMRQILLKQ